jgi:hypothetical protein
MASSFGGFGGFGGNPRMMTFYENRHRRPAAVARCEKAASSNSTTIRVPTSVIETGVSWVTLGIGGASVALMAYGANSFVSFDFTSFTW